MYKLLGQKVKCKGYLRRIYDGTYITCYNKQGLPTTRLYEIETACLYGNDGTETELLFEGDGADKTLYKLIYKFFNGIIVGEKKIATKEYLFADNFDNSYTQYNYIGKEYKEFVDCYVVYYANNKKRFVPKHLCDLE